MQYFSDINLYFPNHILLVSAAAALCLLFVIWVYRKTNPPVSLKIKILLISVKSSALLLICLVLFRAVLTIQSTQSMPPILAVGIDQSASMGITDQSWNRRDIVQSILTDSIFQQLNRRFDLSFFPFANTARQMEKVNLDSLKMTRDLTNIIQSLREIKKYHADDHLTGILLISDGSYNAGGNPARIAGSLGVPVHSIPVGSAAPESDIAITDADIPSSLYQHENSTLEFTIKNTGYGPLSIPVQLQIDGEAIKTETIQVPSSSEIKYLMNFIPQKAGEIKLEISALARNDEQSLENNTFTGYATVFRDKIKINMLAGQISSDISFTRRYIETAERYDLSVFIQKPDGAFYNEKDFNLQDSDILILYNYPLDNSRSDHVKHLENKMQDNVPTLFLTSRPLKMPLPVAIEEAFPVSRSRSWQQQQPVTIRIAPGSLSFFKLETPVDNSFWQQLPPVYTAIQWTAKPETRVLAYSEPETGGNTMPFLATMEKDYKSAVLCAQDLWRWDLVLEGLGEKNKPLQHLVLNILKWLETPQSERDVQLHMGKKTYKFGETVEFTIHVRDQSSDPVADADVQVFLKHPVKNDTLNAVPEGNGNYTLTHTPKNTGEYQVEIKAFRDSRSLGSATSRFKIGDYNAELASLQAQPDILQACSNRSGGLFIPPDSLHNLLKIHAPSPLKKTTVFTKQLWNHRYLLLLIILLLAAEWFIRKRAGML